MPAVGLSVKTASFGWLGYCYSYSMLDNWVTQSSTLSSQIVFYLSCTKGYSDRGTKEHSCLFSFHSFCVDKWDHVTAWTNSSFSSIVRSGRYVRYVRSVNILINAKFLVSTKCLPTEKSLPSTKHLPSTKSLPFAKRLPYTKILLTTESLAFIKFLVIDKHLIDKNLLNLYDRNVIFK